MCKQLFCRCFYSAHLFLCICCSDCLNIKLLTHLQGYGLKEGTDPCVFYTQLTKLLNLIALLGINLCCGNLTLFFNLCLFVCLFVCFLSNKMLWDWSFLWHTLHARQVWSPCKKMGTSDKKRNTCHSNAAPSICDRMTLVLSL